MGALHQGHARLIDQGRQRSGGAAQVLVSVYVNPLQFGPDEDFARYPRDLNTDVERAQAAGASAVWCPDDQQIYPGGAHTTFRVVVPASLQSHLCGPGRPGHFDGVATVVCRLLALCRPQWLVLGEKDWQQLTILRHLIQAFAWPVRILACATERDADGLACSSRNRYLTATERERALHLPSALADAARRWRELGQAVDPAALRTALEAGNLDVEYVELLDPLRLQPARPDQPLRLLAAAVRCGRTRLIDHTFLMTRSPIVAIDGPAGAGKSTVTRAFAERLGLLYLDTGAMYRAVTWWVQSQAVDPGDEAAVRLLLEGLELELDPLQNGVQVVRVNGRDVTEAIRDPQVTGSVSLVAAHSCVRDLLTRQQRRLGERGGLVAEGRDIGTAVFPDAELKVFLTASPQERARRRAADLEARGHEVPALADLEAQILERDRLDSSRAVAPLVQAEDATELITDGMSIDDVIDALVDLFRFRVAEEVWPTPAG